MPFSGSTCRPTNRFGSGWPGFSTRMTRAPSVARRYVRKGRVVACSRLRMVSGSGSVIDHEADVVRSVSDSIILTLTRIRFPDPTHAVSRQRIRETVEGRGAKLSFARMAGSGRVIPCPRPAGSLVAGGDLLARVSWPLGPLSVVAPAADTRDTEEFA